MQRDTAEETALVNMTAVTITIKKNNFLQMQLCVLCMSIQEKYPHIAPEIIEGERPYSCSSDIFSAGGVVFKPCDHNCFATQTKKRNK